MYKYYIMSGDKYKPHLHAPGGSGCDTLEEARIVAQRFAEQYPGREYFIFRMDRSIVLLGIQEKVID